MLKLTNLRLRRSNVMLNSFSSGVSDAAKEFSGAPEMSVSEIISKPRMFFHQTESAISFKQLQSLADTHGWRQLNKQVNVINSDVKLIDFTSFSISNFSDEEFAVHSNTIELHRVSSILAFPNKVESVLSKAMLSRFQVHFVSPIAHAKFSLVSEGLESNPSLSRIHNKLNFEGGNSSLGLKPEVSLPRM